jgi:hypothetical protein
MGVTVARLTVARMTVARMTGGAAASVFPFPARETGSYGLAWNAAIDAAQNCKPRFFARNDHNVSLKARGVPFSWIGIASSDFVKTGHSPRININRRGADGRFGRHDVRVSRRGESHPPPLSGPDVTVSRHPAPTVRPQVNATSCQWANRPGLYWWTFCSQAIALAYLPRNRLNFCMAHLVRCSLMRHARKNNSER